MASIQNNQEVASLQVSLPQMLDLALGTPEVGAVNLNILHNFLHILLHQINLKNTTVEYRGEHAARIKNIVGCLKPGTSLFLQEYQITDGTGQVHQREHDTTLNADIITADPKKKSSSPPPTARDGGKVSKGVKQKLSSGGAEGGQSVIFVEPITDGAVPTALGFKRLEDSVVKLERQFEALEELATTPEIIERMKGLKTEPLNDMWHVININKRLDATEQGMTKITGMMQDLMKSEKIEVVGTDNHQQLEHINDRLTEVETNLSYIAEDISNFREVYQSGPMSTAEQVHQTKVAPVEPIVSPDPQAAVTKQETRTLHVEKSVSKVEQQVVKQEKKQSRNSADVSPRQNEDSPVKQSKNPSNSGDVPVPEIIDNSPVKEEKSVISNPASPPVEPGGKSTPMIEKSSVEMKKSISSVEQLPVSQEKSRSFHESPGIEAKKSGNVTGSKSWIGPNRRSISSNVELTALKNELAEVRSDISQTKQNFKQLHSRVNELERVISSPSVVPGISRNEGGTSSPTPTPRKEQPSGHSLEQDSIINHEDSDSHSAIQSHQTSQPGVISGRIRSSTPRKNDGARPPSIASSHEVISPKIKIRSSEKSSKHDDDDKMRMMEALRNIEIMYGEAIQNLDGRVIELDQEVNVLHEKIRGIPCGPEGLQEMQQMMMKIQKQQAHIEEISRSASMMDPKQKNGEPDSEIIQEIQDMVGKIQNIQADIEHINQTAARLNEEKFSRELNTNAILEQIELLKTVKADREDLEDALADKADAKAVKRKVSYDQFDTTCDDLARGLEHAVSKLTQQEAIWQQALDEVQREIEGKLDKFELGPIKDFVNNRLRTLQEKLKKLGEQRKDTEAAGTKKMLSDVQCISCDKNVVMRVEEGINYRADPMPCNRTIKPYLAYELDQVRRQQKKLPSRNMIQFNAAVKEMGHRSKLTREENIDGTSKDHLCNRYCGGSHTITTPHQRVLRMGHFLAQWGPEAVQLTDAAIKGTDGQLYRGRKLPPSQTTRKSESSSPRGPTESEGERPTTPQHSVKSVSPQKSQMSQRRSSGVAQAASKRSLRKTVESIKEIHHPEPITEEPPPSPRSEPENPQEPEAAPETPQESPTNDDEYNGGDEMD